MRSIKALGLSVIGALIVGGAVLVPWSSAVAGPPKTLAYQGRLVSADGVPREGVVERMVFRLYSTATPSSASLVWAEAHRDIVVHRGAFSVYLGAGAATVDVNGGETEGPNPFGVEFEAGAPRFLEIQVNDEPPLRPLSPLTSVPYALSAGVAGGVWDPSSGAGLDVPALDDRYFRRLSSDGSQASVPSADALRDPATGQALTLSALDSRYAVGVSSGAASVAAASKLTFTGGVSVVTSGSEVTIDVAGRPELVESLTSAGGHSKTATIPAGTLAADGEALHVWASGDIGGGGGLRVRFAGVSLFSSPSMAAARGFEAPGRWVIEGRLIRTGPSSVVASFHVNVEGLDADIGSVPESFVQPYLRIDNLQLASSSYALTVDYAFPVVGGGFNPPPPELHTLVNVLRVRKEGR